jgi:hypothetical protein
VDETMFRQEGALHVHFVRVSPNGSHQRLDAGPAAHNRGFRTLYEGQARALYGDPARCM